MAATGQSTTILSFRAQPAFARAFDALANRRGLSRSAFLRQLVAEEALRIASPDRHDEGE